MKKHLIAALIAVLMCLTALCGCAGVRAFEKDLQVVLNVNVTFRKGFIVIDLIHVIVIVIGDVF